MFLVCFLIMYNLFKFQLNLRADYLFVILKRTFFLVNLTDRKLFNYFEILSL